MSVSAYKYLKPHQHYIDRYDLSTVKVCIEIVQMFSEVYEKSLKAKELKKISKKEKIKSVNILLAERLFVVKTREYQRKEETIEKWMAADREKQEKYDDTPAPRGIKCPDCGKAMHATFKDLYDRDDKPMRMLFFLDCSDCKKRRAAFEDGEEWETAPDSCPECDKEITVDRKKKGKDMVWIRSCESCGYKETEVDDFEERRKQWRQEELADKELLKKFRTEFCLSDEKGKEQVETLEAMEVGTVVYEEEMQKYDSQAYQSASQLQQLNIVDLEKSLSEKLKEVDYVQFSLGSPEDGRFFVVPFNVRDSDSSRTKRVSTYELEKLIKETLKDTNWRLMSDGVIYKLGYISGRLRGYDDEEELMKLSASKKEQKQAAVSIDPAKREKYEYHDVVKSYRFFGKLQGIENARMRRLEKEPDGFFLEGNKKQYECCICREYYPGSKIRWRPEGIRCADCWRNIKEGVIPALVWEGKGVYLHQWQIKSDYSVQPMTRKKLEREGMLVGRHLKREDGVVYCTVYLLKDNKEFLKKYPYKPEMDIEIKWSDKLKSFTLRADKIDYSKKSAKKDK